MKCKKTRKILLGLKFMTINKVKNVLFVIWLPKKPYFNAVTDSVKTVPRIAGINKICVLFVEQK